jgi:hypothetical protein
MILQKKKQMNERVSENDEINLHQAKGLSAPGPGVADFNTDREIREDAQEIPQDLPEWDLLGDDDFRTVGESFGGDRPGSEGQGGADCFAADEVTGSVRGIKEDRPDEVGGDDEQHQARRGDNST